MANEPTPPTPPTEKPPAGHVWACMRDGNALQRRAARVGHFAVVVYGRRQHCEYYITHVPTGMLVPVACDTRKQAIAAARELEAHSPASMHALPWGGDVRTLPRADLRACVDALAHAKAAG